MSQDEAYYWVWSHHLQMSYFDHPAMISWLFWLGHFLEPFGNAVRWPAVLLGHLTLLVWIVILRRYFDLERGRAWLWLSLFSPLIGFGSLILTPDLPLVFFWSASVYFFLHALDSRKIADYVFLGACLGAGFCSKYPIVLFVPIAFFYLLCEKKWRAIRWSGLVLLVVTGFAFSLPVLLWNYQNDFSSFKFQMAHGFERPEYDFEWTWTYVLGQIFILFPLIFWKALRAKLQGSARFLIYAAWGPLIFFFLTSFRALVEANWPIAAYPAVFALAVSLSDFKKTTWRTCMGWVFIYAIVFGSLYVPQLNLNDKLREPWRFQPLVPLVPQYQPLYASTYQMASSLWYVTKVPIYKLQEMNRYDFYDTLKESRPTQNLFYLVAFKDDNLPEWVRRQNFQVKELKKIDPDFVLLEVKRP